MSTAFIDEDDGVNPLGEDEQASSAFPAVASEPTWYSVDNSASTQFAPIQASGGFSATHPPTSPMPQQTASAPSPQDFSSSRSTGAKGRKGSGTRLLVILGILVLLIIAGSVSVFASAAPGLFANHAGPQTNQGQGQQPVVTAGATPKPTKSALQPTPTPKVNTVPTPMPGTAGQAWFSTTLPASCSAAGLMPDQAANAHLEAVQFTLREESISFRNIDGLQSSTSLMTAQAKALRFVNDRRSTKAFARAVLNQKLIQAPENLQPSLKQCQQRGGQTFAWVVVSFERVTQCALNDQGQPCPPNTNFAPEMNQQNQPIIHTMAVLMVAVPSGQPNPPLWLGWSVVDYMIDEAPALPDLPAPGQV